MRPLMLQLWSDDGGAIIAIEWLFFVVIVLIGLVVGFVSIRNAVVDEITAVSNAIDALAVCYSFAGLSNCESSVCGTNVISVQTGQLNTFKTPATFTSVIVHNPCQ